MTPSELESRVEQEYQKRKKKPRKTRLWSWIGFAAFVMSFTAAALVSKRTPDSPEVIFLLVITIVSFVVMGIALVGRLFIASDNFSLRGKIHRELNPRPKRPRESENTNSSTTPKRTIREIVDKLDEDLKKNELEDLEHQLKVERKRFEIEQARGGGPQTSVQGPSIQDRIDEQQEHIRQLERDRDEELASITKNRRFDELASDKQDRYMQADNSWEEKIEAEREKLREIKQRRRTSK